MKGGGNDNTIFNENSSHGNNQAKMFSQLPSTSNSFVPSNLWENQQWQNYCQQYWTNNCNNRYPFQLQNDFSSNTTSMTSKSSFNHSPLSTSINIFTGYPTLPATLPSIGQQYSNNISYDNNQIINAGTSSNNNFYQQSPLPSSDSINLQIESKVNPWLFPTTPKVYLSVNSYGGLDNRINNNNNTTSTTLNNTKIKTQLINNNNNTSSSSSSSLPQSASVSTCQQISRQRFGPGTNNLRVRTKDQYRIVYNEYQRIELERAYVSEVYVNAAVKAELSSRLHLTERQIKIWFQNRRAKERKKEKQLKEKRKQQQQQQQNNNQNINNNNSHHLNYTYPLDNNYQQIFNKI